MEVQIDRVSYGTDIQQRYSHISYTYSFQLTDEHSNYRLASLLRTITLLALVANVF